jgi:hypothetical protein
LWKWKACVGTFPIPARTNRKLAQILNVVIKSGKVAGGMREPEKNNNAIRTLR